MSYYNIHIKEYDEDIWNSIEYTIFEYKRKDGYNYIAKLSAGTSFTGGKQTIAVGYCISHPSAVHWIEQSIWNMHKKRDFHAIALDDYDIDQQENAWECKVNEGVDIYV